MTIPQAYRITIESDWRQTVLFAITRQALAIYAENPATTGHAARAALAVQVVNHPDQYVPIFAQLIGCDDAFLLLTVPAGNLLALATQETRVAAVWNVVAGV